MRKAIVFWCSALLSLIAASAYSATLVPAKTVGDFIEFCASNQDGCGNEIALISMNDAANSPPMHICFPSTAKNEETMPAVLKWLSEHQNTSKMETDSGIYLALRTLYPCK